jgi:cell wall-associated NlpC family hydrolase
VANGGSIKRDMGGPPVKELQRLLNQRGANLTVDGKFSSETYGALKRFQRQNGLTADGKAGRKTIVALRGQSASVADAADTVDNGSTSSAAGRALGHARSQVGVRERSGRNDGIPAQRYSGGRREPWCANFVAWTYRKAGKPLPGNQRSLASVQYMEDRMKRAGAWTRRSRARPKPGDVIFFKNRGRSDRGSGRHVGMVEKVANGRVYTIEGNSGNRVRRRSYPLNNHRISGYGRW